MKRILKRLCYETQKKECFVASGIWSDGHYAYSKISFIDGKPIILNCDNGVYYQQRIDGCLVMIHA